MGNEIQKKTRYLGIDYSLQILRLCKQCDDIMFYYLTKKKKHLGKIANNIIGEEHKNTIHP
ncbi:MAG: hypothetical protein CM15mV8_1740 [Caudoviricetes sp.]|nr:MAG: hypothetical protein CM15mV8_1740 [Caudoviricetes sp.]